MTIIRPTTLPDELAVGYRGRLMRLNGWESEQAAQQALLSGPIGSKSTQADFAHVELLARVAGMTTTKFICNHTLLPMRRAVARLTPGLPHGDVSPAKVHCLLPMRRMRSNAFFCRDCVEQDLDIGGMPYWRREHQLPGFFWCSKHRSALSQTRSGFALHSSPSAFYDHAPRVSERWIEALKECLPLQRFHAICLNLLATPHSLDGGAVSKVARKRAQEMGLITGRSGPRRNRLGDLIRANFNKRWLDSTIPGLNEQPPKRYWMPVDRALTGTRTTTTTLVYALAFSVLYDSADEAIDAMHGHAIRARHH